MPGKNEWIQIYNVQNIIETEQLAEMVKQNGIDSLLL